MPPAPKLATAPAAEPSFCYGYLCGRSLYHPRLPPASPASKLVEGIPRQKCLPGGERHAKTFFRWFSGGRIVTRACPRIRLPAGSIAANPAAQLPIERRAEFPTRFGAEAGGPGKAVRAIVRLSCREARPNRGRRAPCSRRKERSS